MKPRVFPLGLFFLLALSLFGNCGMALSQTIPWSLNPLFQPYCNMNSNVIAHPRLWVTGPYQPWPPDLGQWDYSPFLRVALHESGHVLGLQDGTNKGQPCNNGVTTKNVMWYECSDQTYNLALTALSSWDIAQVRRLYGLGDELFKIEGPFNGGNRGLSGSRTLQGQTIRNADIHPGTIQGIEITLSKKGNPKDNVIISLRQDLFGPDLTAVAVRAGTLPEAPGEITPRRYVFDAPIATENVNFLVLRRSGINDNENLAILWHNDPGPGVNLYRFGNYFECQRSLCVCACPLDSVGEPAYDVVFSLFGKRRQ